MKPHQNPSKTAECRQNLAEGEGFEPPAELLPRLISSQPDNADRTAPALPDSPAPRRGYHLGYTLLAALLWLAGFLAFLYHYGP